MTDITFKVSPDALKTLLERINNASEDLQKDTVEIQYLLSQLNNSVSGSAITNMIHGTVSEIEHCEQLCQRLKEIPSDLWQMVGLYSVAESNISAQIQASLSTVDIA